MKICLVSTVSEVGGAERTAVTLAEEWKDTQNQLLCACPEPGSLSTELSDQGVESFFFGKHRMRNIFRSIGDMRFIARLAREQEVDLVFCNGDQAHILGSMAAWACGLPSVWRWCNYFSGGIIDRLSSRISASAVVADSDNVWLANTSRYAALKEVHHRSVHLSAARLFVDCSVDSQAMRTELGIPQDAWVVGMVGRMQPWKGQEVFLRAAAEVLKHPVSYPLVFLVVGGTLFGMDPEYPARLRRLARELGIENQVIFTGHRNDVEQVMGCLNLFVMPSKLPEPFGTVMVEAMVLGKPVVCTRIGGPLEVLEDGVTGVFAQPDDDQDLARCILALRDDSALAQRIARSGAEHARAQYTGKRMAREYQEFFREIVQKNSKSCE